MITVLYIFGLIWVFSFFYRCGDIQHTVITGIAGAVWTYLFFYEVATNESVVQIVLNLLNAVGWFWIAIDSFKEYRYAHRKD